MLQNNNPETQQQPNNPSIVEIVSNPTLQLLSPKKNLPTMETLPRSFPSTPAFPLNQPNSPPEEAKELSESSSSRMSTYQNLYMTDLINQQLESSRRKDEIEELSFTVKQILKSSEGYRQQLLQVYKGKSSAKVENAILKKTVEGLKLQKASWELEREKMQQIIDSHQESDQMTKEHQNKMIKNVESQRDELEKELQFQKKRNSVLQFYNNELFNKLTSKSDQQSTLQLLQNREVELLNDISKLKLENAALRDSANKFQREYQAMTQNYKYIKNNLESVQIQLGKNKSSYISSSGNIQSIKNDYEIYSKQQLQKLQNKNIEIIEREKDISDLRKKLQEERNAMKETLKENSHLKQTINTLKEEINSIKGRPYPSAPKPTLKETSLREIELEHKIAELNNLLAHEKLIREHLGEQLKQQQQIRNELENQRDDLNSKFVELQMEDNNKVIELSTLLLKHQGDIKQLTKALKQNEQQRENLQNKIQSVKKQEQAKLDSEKADREQEKSDLLKKIHGFQIKLITNEARMVDLETQIRKNERIIQDQRLRYQEARFLINKIELNLSQEKRLKEEAENNFKKYIGELNQSIAENTNKFQNIIKQADTKTKQLEKELNLLNQTCEARQSDLAQKDTLIQRKSSVLEKLNTLISDLTKRIKDLQEENTDIRTSFESQTKYFDQSIQEANYKIEVLEIELKNVKAVSQTRKTDLEQQECLIDDKNMLLDQQNTLISELKQKICEIETKNKRQKDHHNKKSSEYEQQIKKALQKIQKLETELNSVSNVCQSSQQNLKQKEVLIQNKATILEKLSLLMEDLNQKIVLLEEDNELLSSDYTQLQLRNNALNDSLTAKDAELVKKQQQIDRVNLLLGLKSQEHEAEANLLRVARSKSQNKLAKVQDQAVQEVQKLEDEINRLKLTEKRFAAAEQTLRSLADQIKKSQHLWNEMSRFPPPSGIKKFVNLMNSTHRSNFGREVDKILEYFGKVQSYREELGKHYNSIKVIFNLLDQGRYFDKEEKKQKKLLK